MNNNVLIVGANSAIARAIAARLAERRCKLLMAGLDLDELTRTANDLRLRYGVECEALHFDALDLDSHEGFFAAADRRFDGGLSGIVFCVGWMADQALAAANFAVARRMIDVNYTSAVSLLNHAGNAFEARRRGWICALSSVAGDRGRQSNYLYGSTKAALSAYLGGLRNRLAPSGVAVITVKPGCVDTAMTYGLDKLPLVVAPERVAADVDRAIARRKPVVYTPWPWWGIMAAIRLIPERVFQRMKL
jgi:decaprenylphospho-beta-D-erythro-pentofuranosid-2-ulose 2-reductase